MKVVALLLFAAIALLAWPATAGEDERPWSVDASIGNEFMSSERPTGGLSIVVGARRTWRLNERLSWHGGLVTEAFGFAGGSHWMGALVGPSAGISIDTPVEGLSTGMSVNAAYGRVPACTDWGFCMRFWGLFPGGSLRVAYGGATIGATADLDLRYINTLAWSGAAVGLRGGGVVRW